MDLGRAANRFTDNPILGWDSSSGQWVLTDVCGSLQVFDRFVTERTFGQKKRILLVPEKLPANISTIKMQGSEEAFLVEKFNEDVRQGELYSYIYLIHEASHFVDVMKETFTENAAGVSISNGTQVVESVWVDVDRFTSTPSKRMFEETEYTIVNMTFPSDSIVDSDCYLMTQKGERYNVDEVYFSLDLVYGRGKRIGF